MIESDVEIEDQAVDFFLDENLGPEDQMYLMDIVENDDRLSDIIDNLLLKAIEVSKEGHIEGQGDGTSDSIPARLSDGEFVFTAKAVENIGVENLERLMAEAEADADLGDIDLESVKYSETVQSEDGERYEVVESAKDKLDSIESKKKKLKELKAKVA